MSLSLTRLLGTLRKRAPICAQAPFIPVLACSVFLLGARSAQAAAFVVNTTQDTRDGACSTAAGGCSLYDAMSAAVANGSSSADSIAFNIPGNDRGYNAATGVFSIRLKGELPSLTQGLVTIDGGTQTTFTGNTNPYGPEVEITTGTLVYTGFRLGSLNNSIKNLMVNSFLNNIEIIENANTVESCYLGVDFKGSQKAFNASVFSTESNVYIAPKSNITIGGNTAAKGNVIGYGANGILGNQCQQSSFQNNEIKGQRSYGINIYACKNVSVLYNTIHDVSNSDAPGSAVAIEAASSTGTGNTLRRNSIYNIDGLGIDLLADAPPSNDVGDGDKGSNELQNFPVLTGVTAANSNTTVGLSLNSTANSSFIVDVYRMEASDMSPSGHGQGRTWVGQATLVTNATGNGTASVVAAGVYPDSYYTATATNSANSTSPFAFARQTGKGASNVVTNSNDSGPGSLRNAINYVNLTGGSGGVAIAFNILSSDKGYNAATGVTTISLSSALPQITRANVTIDGATQSAFAGNLNPYGPEIEITTSVRSDAGFSLRSPNNAIRNLLINGFANGIVINGNSNTVQRCYFGVDSTGTEPATNNDRFSDNNGVQIGSLVEGTIIGGNTLSDGNVFGYGPRGIDLSGAKRTLVQYNSFFGQEVNGIRCDQTSDVTIQFNQMFDITGSAIAITGEASSVGNMVRRNSMSGIAGLNIDLGNSDVTPNDVTDTDTGPNRLQNFPIILGVLPTDRNTTLAFSLNSTPSSSYILDFYRNNGEGIGDVWVGQTEVTTDGDGNVNNSLTLLDFYPGRAYSATATAVSTKDTSEFSAPVVAGDGSGLPKVEGARPAINDSSTGAPRTINVSYSDPNGVYGITNARLLVASSPDNSSPSLYGSYDVLNNKLYLFNDAGTALIGGFVPESNNVIENSQGILDCKNTSVALSTYGLTIRWTFIPKLPLSGVKNLYGWVNDTNGQVDGFVQVGTWRILNAPLNVAVSPTSVRTLPGTQQIFTATYSDADGASDLANVRILINTGVVGANSLHAFYYPGANKLYLYNDAGTTLIGGYAPGSANVISNSQGTLDCKNTSVTGSGNTLTVRWAFTPTSAFRGTQTIYLRAIDKAGLINNWEAKATWTIANDPVNGSVTPASSSDPVGTQRVFTTTYSDGDGATDIGNARILINTGGGGANSLYGLYFPGANKLYLYNDAGTTLIGGYAPGSANVISNSQGTLDCKNTSVTGSGNTLTVRWALAAKSSFVGAKTVHLWAVDKAGTFSTLQAKASWNVTVAASPAPSFNPSAGNS